MNGPIIIPAGRLGEADPRAVTMVCDVTGCKQQPRRGPRVVIPGRTPLELGHAPLRVMTPLHYCELHRNHFDVAAWLTDAEKANIERIGRRVRPLGWKPDFDAVRIEHLLITTPEYREFLRTLGVQRVFFG